ncbi:hypothetical protein DPMN_045179 [Dreissena polymorpha]|uniref:Uncharacterized protein n=1 Tax=Dreissena polymorpha TaxID=45954 RepID=A0A9D4D4D7_DREPO|nr:hypothetical protein DPMN_045179 [Dreissena polymorpha]
MTFDSDDVCDVLVQMTRVTFGSDDAGEVWFRGACLLLLGLVGIALGRPSNIELCLCTDHSCGFIVGILHGQEFIYMGHGRATALHVSKIKTFPHDTCLDSKTSQKRFLIDAGPLGHLDIGKDGVSAGVAGVNLRRRKRWCQRRGQIRCRSARSRQYRR